MKLDWIRELTIQEIEGTISAEDQKRLDRAVKKNSAALSLRENIYQIHRRMVLQPPSWPSSEEIIARSRATAGTEGIREEGC